jgi:predicted nucleic acid-binding protein
MTRYMIDAPTLLQLVDSGLTVDPAHQLVAPNVIRSEALQLLLDDVRRNARTEKEALERHERVTEVKIRLLGDRVSRRTAWQIAREHDWDTLRDAEYLAVPHG